MNKISTVAVDLAKHVFQLLGIDSHGKPCFSKRLSRDKFKETLRLLPPCTIVMEACATSHYWGRFCNELGHEVRLLPAQHVTPFVRGNKNDKNDCLAIYEASGRPHIRFVPVKSEHQQAILLLHRLRERLITTRTACMNQTRSLLLEFGIVIPKSYKTFKQALKTLLETAHHPAVRLMLIEVDEELKRLEQKN